MGSHGYVYNTTKSRNGLHVIMHLKEGDKKRKKLPKLITCFHLVENILKDALTCVSRKAIKAIFGKDRTHVHQIEKHFEFRNSVGQLSGKILGCFHFTDIMKNR